MKCDCKDKACKKCREVLWTDFMEGTFLPRWMIDTYNYLRTRDQSRIYIYGMVPMWVDALKGRDKEKKISQSLSRAQYISKRMYGDPRGSKLPKEIREHLEKLTSYQVAPEKLKGISSAQIIFDEVHTPGYMEAMQAASRVNRKAGTNEKVILDTIP